MVGIHITSEIKPLKKVLLHRPGAELSRLTPEQIPHLLFDDIPYLHAAKEEHDAFADLLQAHGVQVVYLENLMAQVLRQSELIRDQFIYQWIQEAGIHTEEWQERIYDYLIQYQDKPLHLVLKTMEGLMLKEVVHNRQKSLEEMMSGYAGILIDPMPNLYFTRDPFASVGHGVCLNRMYSVTRRRETIYGEYILRYHPDFAGEVPLFYDREDPFSIEGGDILNLSETVIAIGISQRTQADAIESLAKRLFGNPRCQVRTVLAFDIPDTRAFMHLDTVFTQIDADKFTVHPGILHPLVVYELTRGKGTNSVKIVKMEDSLQKILEKYLEIPKVTLIKCGGNDRIAAEREQWNDGSNTLCIAPGVVVVYQRNEITNRLMREAGVTVLEIPSAELSRGRGGPRCMSMPLIREH